MQRRPSLGIFGTDESLAKANDFFRRIRALKNKANPTRQIQNMSEE